MEWIIPFTHSTPLLHPRPIRLHHFTILAARSRDGGAAVALGAESGQCLALQSTLRVPVATIMVHSATSCWASQRSWPPWCRRRKLAPIASSMPTQSTTAAASSSLSSVSEPYSLLRFLLWLLRWDDVMNLVDSWLTDHRFVNKWIYRLLILLATSRS